MDTNSEIRTDRRLRFIDFLADKWVDPVTCPVCKNTGWLAPGDVFHIGITDPDPSEFGDPIPIYAFIPIGCTTCSYTMLFNAVQAGVMPTLEQAQELAATNKLRVEVEQARLRLELAEAALEEREAFEEGEGGS